MITQMCRGIRVQWEEVHNVPDFIDVDVYLTMPDGQEYKTRISKQMGSKAQIEDPTEYLYSPDGKESFEEPDGAPPVVVVLTMCSAMPGIRDFIRDIEVRRQREMPQAMNPEAAKLFTASAERIEALEQQNRRWQLSVAELNTHLDKAQSRIFEVKEALTRCDYLLRKYRYLLPQRYTQTRKDLDAALAANAAWIR